MSILNECIELLNNTKLKKLLLEGIEQSNKFDLNLELSSYYIENQHTERKKRAAEALIKTNEYIRHDRLIRNFGILIEHFFIRLNGEPYIIDTEIKQKSGYFCTMIFLFIVKDFIDNWDTITKGSCRYYLPLDIIIKMNKKDILTTKHYIMQVNDMDYSSNQLSKMVPKGADKYIILRCMTNSYALQQKHVVKLLEKNNYIYGEQLPTFREKLEQVYTEGHLQYSTIDEIDIVHDDVISFFANCGDKSGGITNVYLDHKVSDWTSTISMALTLGVIPNNSAYKDYESSCVHTGKQELYYMEDIEENETINNPIQYIVPLINYCNYDMILNKYKGNYTELREEMEDSKNHHLRCPYSWYKLIDYDTGELDLSNTRINHIETEKILEYKAILPEIENISINSNDKTQKIIKVIEIIKQLKYTEMKELHQYILKKTPILNISSIIKPHMYKDIYIKNIDKDFSEIIVNNILTWNKLEEYLNIKINLVGGKKKTSKYKIKNKNRNSVKYRNSSKYKKQI